MGAEEWRLYSQHYDVVFAAAQVALTDCKFKTKSVDYQGGRINASAGMSMASYGESLIVTMGMDERGTRVTFSSSAYTMDWGKSGKNVDRFFSALEDRLAGQSVPVQAAPHPGQSYPQPESYPTEPSVNVPVALAMTNGGIALLMALVMDIEILRMVFLFTAILLIIGGALIGSRSYRAGAVLCGIGGVITIPIGILGIIAASKAWNYA